jgi:hypothetical protein
MKLSQLAYSHHHCPAGNQDCYNNAPWWLVLIVGAVAIGVLAYRRWRKRGTREPEAMASRWERISAGIVQGVRINDRIRFAPVIQSNRGFGYPRRPPGVNSGRWTSWGGSVWIRLGNPESWPDEDTDAKMIKPVEP